MVECGVVERGENLSGHCPIWVRLNLGILPVRKSSPKWVPKKPSWCKAGQEQAQHYKSELQGRLSELNFPLFALSCQNPHCQDHSHSEERDIFMLDILLALVESTYTSIPISGGRGGGGHRGNTLPVPGWDSVEPFRKEAQYWHGVWVKEKRPSRGWLHDTMTKWRRQYHYAVRRAKGRTNKVRAVKLFEAAMKGDTDLLQEMKKIRSGGCGAKPDLPENVANAEGEDEIVDKFREVYAALYSSAGSEAEMETLKEKVKKAVGDSSVEEVAKVTGSVVKKAALSLKPGKSDVSGGYTSDAILNAPDILFEYMAAIYRSFLYHGTMTPSLLACSFLPLLKSSVKDPADTSSYRAIAGSNLFLKLFDKVILQVWGHLLSSDSLQFGFKGKTSTTQCSWLVTEVVQHYLRNGSHPIVAVLDCSKAFDTCKFSTLFNALLEKGVPAVAIRAMMTVYEQQYAWVTWGNTRSDIFPILNGTRQGSVASPALWAIYCDPLIQNLRKLGVGAHVAGLFMGVTMYADDLLLIAPTRGAMQKMLEVCDTYAAAYNISFSTDPSPSKSKSKCIFMVGKKRNLVKPAPLMLAGRELPWVQSATHLGHELHESGTMEHDANIKRAVFIDKSVEIRSAFKFASPVEVLHALKVYCSSFYGSMLWDLSGDGAAKIFHAWNTAVKLCWDCPRETRTYLVQQVLSCNQTSARTDLLARYATFFRGLRFSTSLEVSTMANLVARDIQTTTAKNLKLVEQASNLSVWKQSKQLKEAIKNSENVEVEPANQWRVPLLSKLLGHRQELSYCGEETEEISALINSLCIN